MTFGIILNNLQDRTPMGLLDAMVSSIKDYEVQDFIVSIIDSNESIMETFQKAASSSGKYHPAASNGKWGLLNHTAIALLAFDTFEAFYIPQKKLTKDDCDIVRAAIILHDAWKYESLTGKIDNKYTTKEHGYVGCKRIHELMIEYKEEKGMNPRLEKMLIKIASCVRYHMSNWNHTYEETVFAQTKTDLLERLVMICDFLSSNKALNEYTKIV